MINYLHVEGEKPAICKLFRHSTMIYKELPGQIFPFSYLSFFPVDTTREKMLAVSLMFYMFLQLTGEEASIE